MKPISIMLLLAGCIHSITIPSTSSKHVPAKDTNSQNHNTNDEKQSTDSQTISIPNGVFNLKQLEEILTFLAQQDRLAATYKATVPKENKQHMCKALDKCLEAHFAVSINDYFANLSWLKSRAAIKICPIELLTHFYLDGPRQVELAKAKKEINKRLGELLTALVTVSHLYSKLEVAKEKLNLSLELQRLAKVEQRSGTNTPTDVLEAQSQYNNVLKEVRTIEEEINKSINVLTPCLNNLDLSDLRELSADESILTVITQCTGMDAVEIELAMAEQKEANNKRKSKRINTILPIQIQIGGDSATVSQSVKNAAPQIQPSLELRFQFKLGEFVENFSTDYSSLIEGLKCQHTQDLAVSTLSNNKSEIENLLKGQKSAQEYLYYAVQLQNKLQKQYEAGELRREKNSGLKDLIKAQVRVQDATMQAIDMEIKLQKILIETLEKYTTEFTDISTAYILGKDTGTTKTQDTANNTA